MSLQALLAEVDPAWYASGAGAADADAEALPPALLQRALGSRLGRRLLAGGLAAGPAAHLLAPAPGDGFAGLIARWPRARLTALHRDLGALAYAPAIRAEIGRDAVRRLKLALGNSYLLALDRTVWDGKVEAATQARLADALREVMASGDDIAPALFPLLEQQGRAELQAWAARRDTALGDWARLLHPPAGLPPAHLPEKPVLVLHTHHLSRVITD
ncbi:hypothetical protein LDO26_14795 [Luteimonas sp. BDR2-5]|uniref:hypothetical protein n=1 Tax=Proluteimonas luteida TaxID=2878685 RepID=UPI001E5F29C7|nr:hypothetical protein [Luteimonas sp. BDR2-5]MCD9029460.1 hypothetical protein [Luteimonas sp. BDR2-5]